MTTEHYSQAFPQAVAMLKAMKAMHTRAHMQYGHNTHVSVQLGRWANDESSPAANMCNTTAGEGLGAVSGRRFVPGVSESFACQLLWQLETTKVWTEVTPWRQVVDRYYILSTGMLVKSTAEVIPLATLCDVAGKLSSIAGKEVPAKNKACRAGTRSNVTRAGTAAASGRARPGTASATAVRYTSDGAGHECSQHQQHACLRLRTDGCAETVATAESQLSCGADVASQTPMRPLTSSERILGIVYPSAHEGAVAAAGSGKSTSDIAAKLAAALGRPVTAAPDSPPARAHSRTGAQPQQPPSIDVAQLTSVSAWRRLTQGQFAEANQEHRDRGCGGAGTGSDYLPGSSAAATAHGGAPAPAAASAGVAPLAAGTRETSVVSASTTGCAAAADGDGAATTTATGMQAGFGASAPRSSARSSRSLLRTSGCDVKEPSAYVVSHTISSDEITSDYAWQMPGAMASDGGGNATCGGGGGGSQPTAALAPRVAMQDTAERAQFGGDNVLTARMPLPEPYTHGMRMTVTKEMTVCETELQRREDDTQEVCVRLRRSFKYTPAGTDRTVWATTVTLVWKGTTFTDALRSLKTSAPLYEVEVRCLEPMEYLQVINNDFIRFSANLVLKSADMFRWCRVPGCTHPHLVPLGSSLDADAPRENKTGTRGASALSRGAR